MAAIYGMRAQKETLYYLLAHKYKYQVKAITVLKRQFAAFYSLVVCEFFRQTETP
jgi:hypothetical protein